MKIFRAANRSCIGESSSNGQANSARSGQAMLEYVIVACVLIATLAIFVVFLAGFREYGGRILELAASEYP